MRKKGTERVMRKVVCRGKEILDVDCVVLENKSDRYQRVTGVSIVSPSTDAMKKICGRPKDGFIVKTTRSKRALCCCKGEFTWRIGPKGKI